MLYAHPLAWVRINGALSWTIEIKRGTRQGCPLSPLLYDLVAEPLMCAMRNYHAYRGVQSLNYNLTIAAYADDTLLYIRDPERNLVPMLQEVERFSTHSGLHINWHKSIIFPLTPVTIPVQTVYPLEWTTDPIRYPGIKVHTDAELVLSENYGCAIQKLTDAIEKWIKLPLSILGHIALTQMVVLPRFLFLFIIIPISLPQSFFRTLCNLMARLVWAGKQPRVKWDILTKAIL